MITQIALPRVAAVTERNLVVFRHTRYYLVVLSGFVEPVLYLFSIGVGVGALVGDLTLADGSTIGYAAFVAPAMLASAAMTGAMAETTFNFFSKMKWARLYDAMLATPVRPMEIAIGELCWAMARGTLYTGAFVVLMVVMGLTSAALAFPALLATMLVGMAFGAFGMALSTFMRGWQDFDYVFVLQFAMFLFAGTFAPMDGYPLGLRVLIESLPLTQAVHLVRDVTTGAVGWGSLGHVAYLAAMAAVGIWTAGRRMGRLLCR
jgi:lipooligosaccharide transport system permease protein